MQNIQQLRAPAIVTGSALGAYLLYRLVFSITRESAINSTPVALKGASRCRFRLDTESSTTLTLPDGRKLGYAQYGSPTGRPILYMHGLPGSRMEGAYFHDLGLELGARVIALDRPGYGWSSPHPDRTLLDLPKDVEFLAEHLGLEEYSVMGVSGGGPYALACAAALPRERLKSIAVVCGLGPPDIGMRGANWMHWIAFTFGWRLSPQIFIRWFFQRDPGARLDLSFEERLQMRLSTSTLASITDQRDLEIMGDEDIMRLSLRGAQESFAHGFDAMCRDGRAMCVDWGFRIEDIRPELPVHLWYGRDDNFVPVNHGEQIAARLGNRALLRVEDDTHGSIFIKWRRDVLEGMLGDM